MVSEVVVEDVEVESPAEVLRTCICWCFLWTEVRRRSWYSVSFSVSWFRSLGSRAEERWVRGSPPLGET